MAPFTTATASKVLNDVVSVPLHFLAEQVGKARRMLFIHSMVKHTAVPKALSIQHLQLLSEKIKCYQIV
ncbi:hypothetical protein [Vibrio marisflavi]|uniref:hypothetical protein n=1 Tax=Vibrio marisflavi TaxID=1216040 RepID=UPI001F16260E|nr:hypothetical protein [Vibrio marisflavi]